MFNLLKPENLVNRPIEDGDAGVFLRADGTWQIFTSGKIPNDVALLTDIQRDQANKLMALALVLSVPQIYQMLLDILNDPKIKPQVMETGEPH